MTARQPSKFEVSVNGKQFSALTHRDWYWWSHAFIKDCRPEYIHTASIRHACVCKRCENKHKRETVVKIYSGTHKDALHIAHALFYVGRPSIRPQDIDMVEVKSPDCRVTDIHRLPDGEIKFGITMRGGTIKELAMAGHVHGPGAEAAMREP
jgi:hypothetical protein